MSNYTLLSQREAVVLHNIMQSFSTASAVSATVRNRHGEGARAIHRGLTKGELRRLRRLSSLCDALAIADTRDSSHARGQAA